MPRADLFVADAPGAAFQPSLLEGTPLREVEFVVVDLETTGGSPNAERITEVGAVRVRGGEVLGEFATLVNPGRPIPPTITVLTGITDAMVVTAPREEEVLPSFLEFARGAVIVAHNARFDVGFLRAACARMGLEWPDPLVVDTVALARPVVTKDEAPNHKLGSLARLFHATVAPDHRALTDARATVDVLHGLLGRLAPRGVTMLSDLATATDRVPAAVRRKATLADGLPAAPGVYQFLDDAGRILYVGTATNLRTRVRSYFTAAEKRKRIGEMLRIATSVHPIVVATALEAAVRELRLIAEHAPVYNRRSKAPAREPWIRLTAEPFPRASIVRSVPPDADGVLGPFRSRAQAMLALESLAGAFRLRTCADRLPAVPREGGADCALHELGRCLAPCVRADLQAAYADRVAQVRDLARGDTRVLVDYTRARLAVLIEAERFEEAALERDRCQALLRGAARAQRLAAARAAQILAARPATAGGWEVVCVRHGRLAGTALATSSAAVPSTAESLRLSAEHVEPGLTWAGAALAEETELIAGWLHTPGVRLLEVDGTGPSSPRHGAERALADLAGLVGADPAGPEHGAPEGAAA